MKITGKLECARMEGSVAVGLIYDDINKRFQDGSPVRTSIVQRILREDDKVYIVTLNSIYEVIGNLEGVTIPGSEKV